MLVTKLYGKCEELGHCVCDGDNGCGVEDDAMYDCETCGRSHFKGRDPHEDGWMPPKRKPSKVPSVTEISDPPSPKVLEDRAERKQRAVFDYSPEAVAKRSEAQQERRAHEAAERKIIALPAPKPVEQSKSELPKEVKVDQSAKRIIIEIGELKITIER